MGVNMSVEQIRANVSKIAMIQSCTLQLLPVLLMACLGTAGCNNVDQSGSGLAFSSTESALLTSFRSEWMSAQTSEERQKICFELMNKHLLKHWMPTQCIKVLFGDYYQNWDRKTDGSGYAMVFFVPRALRKHPQWNVGQWYLVIKYDVTRDDGVERLSEYWISNWDPRDIYTEAQTGCTTAPAVH